MFTKAPWRCPKCHAQNIASAEQAGRTASCPGCGCKVRVHEDLFKPDPRDVVNATCLALLTELGGLVGEDALGEAFYRLLPVIERALEESEAKGRESARAAMNGAAEN